jgi:hypothetical protein
MMLTPEQRDYKERTLTHLLARLPELEARLSQSTQRYDIVSSHDQLKEVEAHIARLQRELATNAASEPIADDLCRQIASALTKQKFYMAKRYITKLETIEPFYPELDRLRQEAETEQVSRRTRSLAQTGAFGVTGPAVPEIIPPPAADARPGFRPGRAMRSSLAAFRQKQERPGIRQYLQFHYVASCLVLLLLGCAMAGVGGMSVLRWLIEGS